MVGEDVTNFFWTPGGGRPIIISMTHNIKSESFVFLNYDGESES